MITLALETVVRDTRSGAAQPLEALVRSNEELQALGLRRPLPSPVDLARSSLLVVALGKRPDASVEVELRSAELEGDTLTVSYAEVPGREGASDVISYPVHVVRIDRMAPQITARFVRG